jgi:signal transduction histidine kinase
MLFRKGIVRKTFLFSTILALIVVLIAFAVMYFMLPSYYMKLKKTSFETNVAAITQNLKSAGNQEECADLIARFSKQNNVSVLAFDRDEMLIPALSSPFLSMRESGTVIYSGESDSGAPGGNTFIFQIRRDIADDQVDVMGRIRVSASVKGGDMLLVGYVETALVDQIYVTGTLQPIDEARGVILSLFPYVLVTAIVIGLILSAIYAKQIAKPILQISDAALRMQKMDPGAVSGLHTNDELGQLSDNLDALYTSLRENIASLQGEMNKVNRLERSKTEMMRSASHELKTPVAALNGMLEGMIDNVGNYKDKEKYLVQCKKQVDKLSHLVGEILSASRADVSENELELCEVGVDELLERAIAENQYQQYEKGLRLERQLPSVSIMTDPNILYQALSNLISNAVRYTPAAGEIRIYVTEEPNRRLVIENSCEPIPEDELPKLFEPFYTRSLSRDKATSGTGLGLYIVKRSLERLGIPYDAHNTEFGFCVELWIWGARDVSSR